MDELSITPLKTGDVPVLAQLLEKQKAEYMKRFFPFEFDQLSLLSRVQGAKSDCYWALRWQGELVGFFMLRGFDEGFARPSFGIFVAERYSGLGFATAGLEYALNWCIEKGIDEVMLKVDPKSTRAVEIYKKAGFIEEGKCPITGQNVMIKRIR